MNNQQSYYDKVLRHLYKKSSHDNPILNEKDDSINERNCRKAISEFIMQLYADQDYYSIVNMMIESNHWDFCVENICTNYIKYIVKLFMKKAEYAVHLANNKDDKFGSIIFNFMRHSPYQAVDVLEDLKLSDGRSAFYCYTVYFTKIYGNYFIGKYLKFKNKKKSYSSVPRIPRRSGSRLSKFVHGNDVEIIEELHEDDANSDISQVSHEESISSDEYVFDEFNNMYTTKGKINKQVYVYPPIQQPIYQPVYPQMPYPQGYPQAYYPQMPYPQGYPQMPYSQANYQQVVNQQVGDMQSHQYTATSQHEQTTPLQVPQTNDTQATQHNANQFVQPVPSLSAQIPTYQSDHNESPKKSNAELLADLLAQMGVSDQKLPEEVKDINQCVANIISQKNTEQRTEEKTMNSLSWSQRLGRSSNGTTNQIEVRKIGLNAANSSPHKADMKLSENITRNDYLDGQTTSVWAIVPRSDIPDNLHNYILKYDPINGPYGWVRDTVGNCEKFCLPSKFPFVWVPIRNSSGIIENWRVFVYNFWIYTRTTILSTDRAKFQTQVDYEDYSAYDYIFQDGDFVTLIRMIYDMEGRPMSGGKRKIPIDEYQQCDNNGKRKLFENIHQYEVMHGKYDVSKLKGTTNQIFYDNKDNTYYLDTIKIRINFSTYEEITCKEYVILLKNIRSILERKKIEGIGSNLARRFPQCLGRCDTYDFDGNENLDD